MSGIVCFRGARLSSAARLVLVIGSLGSVPAFALEARLTLNGSSPGEEITIQSFHETLNRPVDPGTGLPSGSATHGPLVLGKYVDQASARLVGAFAGTEVLKTWVLRTYTRGSAGRLRPEFTIELTHPQVVSIRQWTVESRPNSSLGSRSEGSRSDTVREEEVTFGFRTMNWIHEPTREKGTLHFGASVPTDSDGSPRLVGFEPTPSPGAESPVTEFFSNLIR